MPEDTKKIIFLAVYDNKHGSDITAHTTEAGAIASNAATARQSLSDWCDNTESERYRSWTDADLLAAWGEITGYNEFFQVDAVTLEGYSK